MARKSRPLVYNLGRVEYAQIFFKKYSLSLIGSEIHSFSENSEGGWSVPGTSFIEFDADISGVFDSNGDSYPVISVESKKLQIGWRNVAGGILLTQHPWNEYNCPTK